jgi:hypothetical protein
LNVGGRSSAAGGEQKLQRDAGGRRWWSGQGGRRGEVGEYQQVEGDPLRASTWAEEERKVWLDSEVEWRC